MNEPASESTPRRFLASSLASYWGLGIRLLVTFCLRVALARLLAPGEHGLYELALRIVTLAAAVRDLGLLYHLIRDERRPYGTVFVATSASGLLVTLALMLGAPLAGRLDAELPAVLQVLALWVILDGLAGVPRTYFERELRIGRLVVPEIARGLLTAVVAIGLAWRGAGVWSFVVADLVAAAVFAAVVWRRAWGRMPLAVDLAIVPGLLRQSLTLFLIWMTYQLVTYLDLFVVEVFTDTATVGQYARAYWLAFLVRTIVFPRALVPALVEYRDDTERFRAAFRVTTVFLMSCEVTAGYFLFFNAEAVVALALGEQWTPAVALLRILCFVPFLDVFTELGGEVLKVLREDRIWLAIMILNLVSLLGFGIVFSQRWGAAGMAAANFLLLGNAIMAWRMARLLGSAFPRLLADMAWIYLVPLPLFAATALLPPTGWARLAVSVPVAILAFGLLALRFQRPIRHFLQDQKETGRRVVAGPSS